MIRRRANRTQHDTLAMQRLAAPEDQHWEWRPDDLVMTSDGFLGTVTAVSNGVVPGLEEYQVKLHGDFGGGPYRASQLSQPSAAMLAAVAGTAAQDYPELAQVLLDKPDPALDRRTASGKPWEKDDEDGSDNDGDDRDEDEDEDSNNDDKDEDKDGKGGKGDSKDGDDKKGDNPFDKFSSLMVKAAVDTDFRFHVCAAWRDVVAKAKRIRSEGGVRVTMASDGLVVGEVKGDHHVYETGLQRLPGRTAAQGWSCGCVWGAYHWGADDDLSRFSGRMCSHALALQYEAQSRGMFGRNIEADSEKPAWVPRKVVIKYDIDERRHDLARSSSLQATPPTGAALRTVASAVIHAGGDLEEVVLALSTIGVTASVNAPFGEPGGDVIPKQPRTPGSTQVRLPDENPVSAGPLSTPDPQGWGHPMPGTLDDRLGARTAFFEPGTEATLHDSPQPALPATDGADAAIPHDDEALSPNTAVRKQALKDFTPSERRALIDEGQDGTRARNLDNLQIEGTHYAALEAELAADESSPLFY